MVTTRIAQCSRISPKSVPRDVTKGSTVAAPILDAHPSLPKRSTRELKQAFLVRPTVFADQPQTVPALGKARLHKLQRAPKAWIFAERKLGTDAECLPTEFAIDDCVAEAEARMFGGIESCQRRCRY